MTLQTRLVAYLPGSDDVLGWLPAPISWSASAPLSADGALTLRYSLLSEGGQIVGRPLSAGLDVGVQVWIEPSGGNLPAWRTGQPGWHECTPRYLLVDCQNNAADTTQACDLTFVGYSWLTGKIRDLNDGAVLRKGKHKDTRPWVSMRAGAILGTLIAEHNARTGPAIPLLHSTWNATSDSDGHPWPRITRYGQPGESLHDVLDEMANKNGVTWAQVGRELLVWAPRDVPS